jgi:hypothetical protein
MNSQKLCMFCGATLRSKKTVSGAKSDEHVIPQWLLEHLGLRKMPITFLRHDVPSGQIVELRQHSVCNFVAGRVCADCNGGWMSDLEALAKPILIRLIADPHRLSNLLEHERHIVARWTFKTAAVVNRTSNYGNSAYPFARPVPDEHMQIVRTGSIPADVVVVGSGCPSEKTSEIVQRSTWASPNYSVPLRQDDRERSYKIGFSFRNLLLAVAHYPNAEYCYGFNERSFVLLWGGTRGIVRPPDGVGEVPIVANSPILEGFLGNIFVVSRTWWTLLQNDATTKFIMSPVVRRLSSPS